VQIETKVIITVTVLIGVLAIVTSNSLDEATGNIATFLQPFESYLFWIGWAAVMGVMIYIAIKLMKRVGDTLDKHAPSEEAPPTDHWAERQRLEISVIANVSVGREPTDIPIDKDPENSRFRELKDAIDTDEMDSDLHGDCANFLSTVTLDEFTMYVAATNKPYWIEVLHRWQAAQPLSHQQGEKLKRRIPLLEFLEIAKMHGWDVMEADGYEGFDLIHGITEAAGLGDLVILGKKINQHMPSLTLTARLQEIPSEFWRTHAINTPSCLSMTGAGMVIGLQKDNAHVQTECDQGIRQESQEYADLYLKSEGLIDWLENDAKLYRGHTEKAYGN